MNISIRRVFVNSLRASPARLMNSCSLAVLSLAGAAAFAGPAAAACDGTPTLIGDTLTITGESCDPLDFGAYASGTNLLVTNTGSVIGSGGNPIGNNGGGAVGSITVDGTLKSRTSSSVIINFNASTNYTPSVGKITFGTTASVSTFEQGGTPVIDVRGLAVLPPGQTPPLFGGFENNGTIDVLARRAPFLNVTNGTVNGSIVNNGTATSKQTFFSAASETINGDFDNRNAITVKNSWPEANTTQALRFAAVTLNGSILNSGAISADNSATGLGVELTVGTTVSGSLTNGGTISGFVTGIFSSVTTIAGGIFNNGTIAAQTTGIAFAATPNGTPTIVNAAGATISGGVNSLSLLQTSGATTVENWGTLSGAVNLGTLNRLNTLNINGKAARVIGDTTGAGVVNVNGTFTSEGAFTASQFNVNSGALFNMNNSITAPVTVAPGGELRLLSPQTVDGNILNNGTISVAGMLLTTTGVYTQSAGATFKTDINYIGAGGYGQLKSAKALDVADGAILFANFASSQKYASGAVIQDVLQGTGTPTKAGKITLVTQGQPISSHYYWSAIWDGANVDLVLTVDETARPAETVRTVNLNKSLSLGLMHQRYATLRVIMDYDCAQFDKYGVCLSMQARATGFGAQATGSGVFNIAYRFADKFRIGAFLDYQASTNSPHVTGLPLERAQAHDNRPTFGGYAGYSESGYSQQALNKGLQLFVSGGMNPGKITMTRAMLTDAAGFVDAQPGSGTARLDTWFVKGMAGYGFDLAPNVRVMPYAGLRYTDVTRGGYVEGYNALVTQPLAYDPYYERLITGFAGAQLSTMATARLGAHIGLGAEVDFKRSASAFSGVSAIPGLPVFGLDHGGAWNGARPAANAGAFYIVAPNQRIFLNGATGQQAFSSRTFASGMLGYLVAF